jgi:hypothetical protein
MGVWDIFAQKAQHLFWTRLEQDHVVQDKYQEYPIENDQAYFLVRLTEMYISYTRKLWRKFYPLLHGYVHYGDQEDHAVAGPGQLKELGEANLDRVITLNYRLCGPIPYKGGDVQVLTGLYSVPGEDSLRVLIDVVSQVANLGGLAIHQYLALANAVKTGVENIINLDSAQLQLGINDTFYQHNPFRSGYYVGIQAPADEVFPSLLWLENGRLMKGPFPGSCKSYEDFDYFVLEIERREHRDDWPGLPGIADMQEKFAGVMRDGALTVDQKRARLQDVWPGFTQALSDSPYLVKPDRERIAYDVSQDLLKRLEALGSGNPFKARAFGTKVFVKKEPVEFDFLDVPQYVDWQDKESVSQAQQALGGNPFQG